MFGFYWNCLKSDYPTRLEVFKLFLIFFVLFNPFTPGKTEKDNFNSTNFKH